MKYPSPAVGTVGYGLQSRPFAVPFNAAPAKDGFVTVARFTPAFHLCKHHSLRMALVSTANPPPPTLYARHQPHDPALHNGLNGLLSLLDDSRENS